MSFSFSISVVFHVFSDDVVLLCSLQSDVEEEELTLRDALVTEKYKLAGGVCNTVLAALIAQVKVCNKRHATDQKKKKQKKNFFFFFFFFFLSFFLLFHFVVF